MEGVKWKKYSTSLHLTAVQLQPTSHRHDSEPTCVLVLPRHHPPHGSFSTRPPHGSDPSLPGETHGSEGSQEPHSPFSQDNPSPYSHCRYSATIVSCGKIKGALNSLIHIIDKYIKQNCSCLHILKPLIGCLEGKDYFLHKTHEATICARLWV